jgi:hypothetical protein
LLASWHEECGKLEEREIDETTHRVAMGNPHGDHIIDRHGPFAQPDESVFDDPGITEFGKAHEAVQRRIYDLHRNVIAGVPL